MKEHTENILFADELTDEELEKFQSSFDGLNNFDDEIPKIDGYEIACGFAVKDEDIKVMNILKDYSFGSFPSVSKLAELTGLPEHRVKRTFAMLNQQTGFVRGRKALFDDEVSDHNFDP